MKELSIEEKAKAYDKAIKIAMNNPNCFVKDVIEDIFPELKESEEEWIRQRIIQAIRLRADDMNEEWSDEIAWLEKQGEQKSIDKVEPIFNVGDKIQYLKGCGTIMTIEKIENGEYVFSNNMGRITIENGNKWYLVNHVEQNTAWSEGDEKMLDFAIRAIGLCKQYAINHQINGYSKLSDVLNRYEELQTWLKSLKDRVQPQQEWSEEDIKMFVNIKACLRNAAKDYSREVDWLMSIKPQPKQEWSEEDENYRDALIGLIKEIKDQKLKRLEDWDGYINWLKSIRPQNRWKPSDKQMKALAYAVFDTQSYSYHKNLSSLEQQLKKLKG